MNGLKKMGAWSIINTAGAICAYLIGAGFASGQEVMQFYSSWGSVSGLIEISTIFGIGLTVTYLFTGYIGRTRNAPDVNALYEVVGGKYLGKLLSFFVWAYNLGCYFFMISGFGNVLHQQFGMEIWIGSGIAAFISAGTALLGLRKIVDIIGKIGPLVVAFALILGIASLFFTAPNIDKGCELIQSGQVEVTRAGHSILLSAFSYIGVCVLLPFAFVAHLGYGLREYEFKDTNIVMIVGCIAYLAGCVVLAFNYLGDIANCAPAAIPNLILASRFFSGVGLVFAIIILLSIYSTMVPILWTCGSMIWENEKSLPYRLFIIICAGVVYFITLYVPYQTLINYIMTYFGYAGFFSAVIIVYRGFVFWMEDRKKSANVVTNGE